MVMNAQPEADKKLKPVTLGLIVSFFILIVLILSFGIVPQYIAIKGTNEKINTLTLELDRQEKLFPLYAKAIQMGQFDFSPKLPFPEQKALERHKISQLSQTFDQLASEYNMKPTGNSLDVQKIGTQSIDEKVSIDLRLTGQLFDFRKFMIAICGLPFFDSVENIRIEPVDTTKKRFITKIRINLNKK